MAREAKELRAKVADIEKSNELVKSTSNKRQNKKRLTVAKRRVFTLKVKLMKARDAQERSIFEAKKFEKRAPGAATQ